MVSQIIVRSYLIVAVLFATAGTGCSFAPGESRASNAQPDAEAAAQAGETRSKPAGCRDQGEGVASWYGEGFHGETTASGETYDMNDMTAAHRTLPFGSQVEVTNLSNGKSATLTVNDRGPKVPNRMVDVSRKGAEELGFIDDGLAPVRVEVVKGC